MNETLVTVQGNVATDVTLRTTRSGQRVASFRLASTPRRFDRSLGEWVDGPSAFYSVSCWRNLADNVKQSLRKGTPVLVLGRLTQRPYESEVNGQTIQFYSLDLDARVVGPDLTRGVAAFERVRSAAVRQAEDRARQEIEETAGAAAGPDSIPQPRAAGPLVTVPEAS